MSKLNSLEAILLHELRDLYSAEKQLLKALPKIAKAAISEDLKEAFQEHLAVTEKQIERLDEIFTELDKASRGPKCAAMEGLVEEASELMKEDADEMVMDAGLIAAAQR